MTWTLIILILIGMILVNLPLILISRRLTKTKTWNSFRKPKLKARECQSCQQFISCAMAGVEKCPLLLK